MTTKLNKINDNFISILKKLDRLVYDFGNKLF